MTPKSQHINQYQDATSQKAKAHTTEDELRDALIELNESGAEAIVQVGTNLSMVRLAAEAERWFHKPVVAINAATWWMALRENGINDKLYGYGRMFEDF